MLCFKYIYIHTHIFSKGYDSGFFFFVVVFFFSVVLFSPNCEKLIHRYTLPKVWCIRKHIYIYIYIYIFIPT